VKTSGVNIRRYVTVPVTTLWTSPAAPREVDASAVAPHPDVVAWLADLDAAEARLGLHDRMLTQLEAGEPVDLVGDPESSGNGAVDWLQIVAPMQPSSLDPRGYPGWVPASHLGADVPDSSPLAEAAQESLTETSLAESFVQQALSHAGLPYLWGGMCTWGLDCSGLVALSLRRLGVVVPRDADDQYDACEHVPADEACPGDLFFFAREGKRPHHVGIVTGPGRMLHAPETGAVIVEEELNPARRTTLIGAGRLASFLPHHGSAGSAGDADSAGLAG